MKKAYRFPMILMVFAVWVGVSFACASLTPKNELPRISTPNSPSLTPIIPTSKLGEVVEQFGYSFSATKVEYPTGTDNLGSPKKAGYKTVAIEITLGNVSGAEALSVYNNYAYLVDSDGFVYQAQYGYGADSLDMVYLNIGEKVKGWVYFSIPENATPAYIKYKTNYSNDNESFLMAGLAK